MLQNSLCCPVFIPQITGDELPVPPDTEKLSVVQSPRAPPVFSVPSAVPSLTAGKDPPGSINSLKEKYFDMTTRLILLKIILTLCGFTRQLCHANIIYGRLSKCLLR